MNSTEDWLLTEKFWGNIVKNITLGKGYPDDWVDVYERFYRYANRSFEFPNDFIGLAIYHQKSKFLSKGIKIFHEVGKDKIEDLGFWIEHEREFLDIDPPHTLTICCTLNESNINAIQNLLIKWIDIREMKEEKDLF